MERLILVIDDDIDEMDFFQYAQKEMPGTFTCKYLDNSVDAVKTITELRPHLVFLDINMPVLNGFECLAEIKDSTGCKDVPVILYSTSIDDATCKKALSLGAAECLQKPVLVSAFQKMLEELLNTFQ